MQENEFRKNAVELIRRYGDTPLRRWVLCADIEGLADFLEVDADDRKEELLAVREVFGDELGTFRATPLWVLDKRDGSITEWTVGDFEEHLRINDYQHWLDTDRDDDALWEYRSREEAEEARAEQAVQGRWAEDEEDDAE